MTPKPLACSKYSLSFIILHPALIFPCIVPGLDPHDKEEDCKA